MRLFAGIPFAAVLIAFSLSSCERTDQKSDYLARVNDAYLTADQIIADGDSSVLASPAALRDYVSRWVNNELLYMEARRQGIENSEAVQRQLLQARKRLSVAELLESQVYGDTARIKEDSIKAYFALHADEFVTREGVLKLRLVTFSSRETANAFRAKIMSGTSWESAIGELRTETDSSGPMLAHADGRYYTQHTLYPPEIWRVASDLAPTEVSFPVKTQGGFFVIQSLAVLRPGARAELDMVRDEIRQRLIMERRRLRYADLLARLHSKYEIEVTLP